jgi:hypothetical protein
MCHSLRPRTGRSLIGWRKEVLVGKTGRAPQMAVPPWQNCSRAQRPMVPQSGRLRQPDGS